MEVLAIYERIVLSDLRPNLSKYETKEGLEELKNSIYSFKLTKDADSEITTANLFDALPSINPGDNFEIDIDNDNRKILITIHPNPDEEELINIDIEPPRDEKGEIFYQIIEDEFIRIKKRLAKVLAEASSHDELSFFALKFITKAKQLGREAHDLEKRLRASNTQTGKSSRHVVVILKKFLVYSIIEAQEIFASIIKLEVQSEGDIEDELYEFSHTKAMRGAKELGERWERKRIERIINSIAAGKLSHIETNNMDVRDIGILEKTALETLGSLNFEKACEIISEGISDRMPGFLSGIQRLNDLRETDKKQFEGFEEMSKEEIRKKIKENIYKRRDSLVSAYQGIFAKIDEKSVDPEFAKGQAKIAVLEGVVQNQSHFLTLRQYPSDWNNEDLFGTLWGYSILVKEWNTNSNKIFKETVDSKEDEANSTPKISLLDKQISWIKNHKVLSIVALAFIGLIWLANATDALVKLGIVDDNAMELQRQEFFNNNLPQFDLRYSAFYPENRDPLLKGTLLDDTVGITGSYRLINTGRAVVTLEKIDLPKALNIRGYFADKIVGLPYSLASGDTIVISCKLPGKELPIIETEKALKQNVSLICSYRAANIRFTYKLRWHDGVFRKERITFE